MADKLAQVCENTDLDFEPVANLGNDRDTRKSFHRSAIHSTVKDLFGVNQGIST